MPGVIKDAFLLFVDNYRGSILFEQQVLNPDRETISKSW
ncbi:hypothetical protein CLV42_114181 [Chitinophaga ginsengisoli]|uniref:Uncharacterized protein n=1 Tax=Chitinophaga ginsengisoli TaxID=363837 RepID=A0A2P8FTI5_9BACT|nr:hypothetical protein CLV42_114181 [Chitinophaga ginsengisoli]